MTSPALLLIPLLAGCPHFARPAPAAFVCGAPSVDRPRTTDPARMLAVTPKSAPPADWSTLPSAPANPWAAAPANPWVAAPAATEPPPVRDVYPTLAADMMLDVVADRAPLGAVAVAISRATHLDIVVQPQLQDLPLTLSMHDVSLAQLQQVLADAYDVHAAMSTGVLYLADFDHLLSRQLSPQVPALRAVLIDLPEDVSGPQLATAWCEHDATAQGYATVLGDAVLFQDTEEAIARAQALRARFADDD